MILATLIIITFIIIYNKNNARCALNHSFKYLQSLGIKELYPTGSIYQGTTVFTSDIDYIIPYDTLQDKKDIQLCLADLYKATDNGVGVNYITVIDGYKIDVQLHPRHKCAKHLQINSIVANYNLCQKLNCILQKNIASYVLSNDNYNTWKRAYIYKGAFDNF